MGRDQGLLRVSREIFSLGQIRPILWPWRDASDVCYKPPADQFKVIILPEINEPCLVL